MSAERANVTADPQLRILKYVRECATETGDLPPFSAVADRCNLTVAEVRHHVQAAIDAGSMYQVCCGEGTGIYVRLPGETDGRRVSTQTP